MPDTPKSNPFTDVNPYRAGGLPNVATRRPGGLTAICIVAIVLGVLGLFSGAMKGVNAVFGERMQQAFGSIGAATPGQAKVQKEMQAALGAEMRRFAVANGVLCVVQLGLCAALLYAGVKTLGFKPGGRKLLLSIFICLLMYEVGQLVTVVIQQMSISPIMELYMPRMMKDPSGNNAGAERFGLAIARMSIIMGIVFQCVWALIKFIFFAIAIRYLCQAKIVALFEPSPTPVPLKPEVT